MTVQTSVENHETVLRELRAAVGDEFVVDRAEALDAYADPFGAYGVTQHRPGLAVSPSTVDEVRDVVRIAAKHGMPLWTTSQGRNNAYGGAAPVVGGSVVVSMKRMNRILEVDVDRATALVEPGVRFFDMYDHLRDNGIPLWSSAPDLGWGSIVGNALEYGVGYTVHGDHAARTCGYEVVLPDGDLLRTGMGAVPGSGAWQAYPRAYGPSADGLFRQSSLGIVTKMGIWLMPEPDYYLSGVASVPRREDLRALLETIRPLVLDGTFQNQPAIGHALFVASVIDGAPSRQEIYPHEGPVPEEIVLETARSLGIGRWNMRFALYGTELAVRARFRRIQAALLQIPGAVVSSQTYAGHQVHDTARDQNSQVQAGIPSLDLMKALDWYSGPGGGHLDFSVVSPLRGEPTEAVHRMIDARLAGSGLDWDPALIVSGRCVINVAQIYFHPDDQVRSVRAFEVARQLIDDARRLDLGVYRTHVDLMDDAAAQYDFNDHAMLRVQERLKDALDPGGILDVGKQGVWPARFRSSSAAQEVHA